MQETRRPAKSDPKKPGKPAPKNSTQPEFIPDAKELRSWISQHDHTVHDLRAFIFQHPLDFPNTTYGYENNYTNPGDDYLTAWEEGKALKSLPKVDNAQLMQAVADKEAQVRARVSEIHASQATHRSKIEARKEAVKAAASKMQLEDVMQVPLDNGPEEWAREETPERAQAPWPPLEEEEAAMPQLFEMQAAGRADTKAADDSPSPVGSRPAVRVKAKEESSKKETRAEARTIYFKGCKHIFAGLDLDGDDAIQDAEIFAFFDAVWQVYEPQELMHKFLAEADVDSDGQVSKGEWDYFANSVWKRSISKAKKMDPLRHLRLGITNRKKADMENNFTQIHGFHTGIVTRLFQVMDVDGNKVVSKAEMQAFIGTKYPTKDSVKISEKFLAEADMERDGTVTTKEFQHFAEASRAISTTPQEKWNPLLRLIA